MQKVTDDQIVEAIQNYMFIYTWSPSVREIAGMVEMTPGGMQPRLIDLREQGRIVHEGVRQIRVIK